MTFRFCRRTATAVLLSLALAGQVGAERDTRYQLFEDWQALGYVTSIQDTGPMSMSFQANCRAKDVFFSALRVLPRLGFFIDKKNDVEGSYGITTDWKTKPVNGFGSFVSGINGVRARLVLTAQDVGGGCNIQARSDLEVSESGGSWRAETSTEMRNDIRQVVATVLVRPLYGNYDELAPLLVEYSQGDKPVFSREEAWKRIRVSGFKGFEEAAAAAGSPPVTPVLNPAGPGISLKGQVKFKELATLQGTKPIVLTLAEDEAGQKALQLDAGGAGITLGSIDCMLLVEYAKDAMKLRESLKPGESELGKQLAEGPAKLQLGAKVTSAKTPIRLLLVNLDQAGGVTKVELPEAEARRFCDALERGNAFFQGRELIR